MSRRAAAGLVLLAIDAALLSGCARAVAERVRHRIDENSAATQVELTVGQVHEVELTASAGTGYEWTLVSADPVVAVSKPRTEALDVGRLGGPVAWRFELTGVKPGPGRVNFALVRPWETGTTPAQTALISVRVDPQ